MDSVMFKTLVQVESHHSTLPNPPERVVSRKYPAIPQDDPIELVRLPSAKAPADEATPDLEMSRPATPGGEREAAEALQNLPDSPRDKYRFAVCCSTILLSGLNDSAAGALIPYMETYYDIGYAVVSLMFVGVAAGFMLAAPCIDALQARLGRAGTLAAANLVLSAGYAPVVAAAPFAAIVAPGFLLAGLGFAVNLAVSNVFAANLRRAPAALGVLHGMYGVGGVAGPLVATSLASHGVPWSRYYAIPLALALANAALSAWAFWGCEREDKYRQHDQHQPVVSATATAATTTGNNNNNDTADDNNSVGASVAAEAGQTARRQLSAVAAALRSRVVLAGAVFIFAYQGAEVSISGWVISFLLSARPGGDPARVGYVTAGFWAGVTAGRFLLTPFAPRFPGGSKAFVYAIVAGAAVFELLVWLVPDIVGDAVAVAVVGLLLGPVWPVAAVVFTRGLPRRDQAAGLSVISAFGSAGGAVAPFTTGLLSQATGPFVLHPIAIGLFAAMILCWYFIPGTRKRTE